jgi:hypothetical protein
MMRGSQHLWGGQSVQKIGAIVGVAAIARAAFVAGRKSSTSRPFGDAAFERACVESVALEYRDKVKAEFRQAELEWEARHSPHRCPVHAAVYSSFERPDVEAYVAQVAPTRVDFAAYTERRIDCARRRGRATMKAQQRPAAGITIGELKTEIDDLPDDAIVVAVGRDGEAHQVFELIRAVDHDPDDFRAMSLLVAFGIAPPIMRR